MNTTIFLPMPEWQALSFLRKREVAFERLLTPAGNHLPCEVVLADSHLYGFKQRKDALEVGKRVYPHGFAMVRMVVLGKMLNGMMTVQRQITSATDPGFGYALWRVSRDGLVVIRDRIESGDCEILVDQLFGGDTEDDDTKCLVDPGEEVNRGFLEDGGRPAGFVARDGTDRGNCGPVGCGC